MPTWHDSLGNSTAKLYHVGMRRRFIVLALVALAGVAFVAANWGVWMAERKADEAYRKADAAYDDMLKCGNATLDNLSADGPIKECQP